MLCQTASRCLKVALGNEREPNARRNIAVLTAAQALGGASPPIVMYTDDGSPLKPYDKPEWPDVYNFTIVAEVCADPSGRQFFVQSTPPPNDDEGGRPAGAPQPWARPC